MSPVRWFTLLILMAAGLAPVTAFSQVTGPVTAGLGLDGSTGLFLNPTSTTLGVGHVRVGVFNGPGPASGDETLPIALALGFSHRMELVGSTMHWSLSQREELSTAGFKVNLLSGAGLQLAADMRFNEITRYTMSGDTLMGSRMAGRLVASFMLGSIASTLNMGMARSEFNEPQHSGDHFTGGLGFVVPVRGNIQALAEIQLEQQPGGGNLYRGAAGVKWFIREHLQIGVGVLADYHLERSKAGLFFNLGFSSERLNVFKWQVSLTHRIVLPSLDELEIEDLRRMGGRPTAAPAPEPITKSPRPPTPEEEKLPRPPALDTMDQAGSNAQVQVPSYLPKPPPWSDDER